MNETVGQRLYLSFLGGLGAALFAWWIQSRLAEERFLYSQFIDLETAAGIAASFPPSEDEFVLAAWRYASEEVQYESRASTLRFVDGEVRCHYCLLPAVVLERGKANCMGKAALLLSLLRYRLPSERVHMAIGGLATDRVGGHAWVVVQRAGDWYLLESTLSPTKWVKVSELQNVYVPSVYLNDQTFYCQDERLCFRTGGADCRLACRWCQGVYGSV